MLQLQNMKLKGPAEFTKIEIPHISKVVEVPRCQSVLLSEDKSTMPESIYSQSPVLTLQSLILNHFLANFCRKQSIYSFNVV